MTRVDGLNHVLRVQTVIRSDYGRGVWGLFGENGWRKGKCMEISAFSDSGVLEDDQEAGIIDPLDLKPSADAFPLCESGLNVSRLQLFREAGERKDASDASRELGEGGGHGWKRIRRKELKGQKKETIEAWVGKVEDDWKAGAVTCSGEVLSEN